MVCAEFKTWSVLNHDDSLPVSLVVITALFRLHLVCPVFLVLIISDTTPAYSKIITTKRDWVRVYDCTGEMVRVLERVS